MDITRAQALVRTILEHAADYAWTMQDIGLLALRLDTRREYRLHVWAPTYSVGEPPIHDHPFDFASTVIVGEMTNIRYDREPLRHRVRPRAVLTIERETPRRTDTVRLSGAATTLAAGDSYHQRAHELHASRQTPGTVTIIRMAFTEVPELAVCSQTGMDWVSDRSHPASPEQVEQITATALDRFSNTLVDAGARDS